MVNREVQRFSIRFDKCYGGLSSSLLLPPQESYVELDSQWVRVQMGWAFRTQFPRSTIISVTPTKHVPLSRGVHGWAGRWLVNGSGQGILTIDLQPNQRAYVMGFPVRLKQLLISVTEPIALMRLLSMTN
jgi:hypothetical protein